MHTRAQHVTQAISWEVAAILWMVVEAILSLGAGYQVCFVNRKWTLSAK